MTNIALGIIKNIKNEILIIERIKDANDKGEQMLLWAFPGGEVEEGESANEAVVREVHEETGYEVEAKSIISERDHPQFPVHIIYIACDVVHKAAESFSSSEIKTVAWVDPEKLGDFFTTDLDPNVAEYFRKPSNPKS
ncbi:NUDIX hydrolase [candidate division WWE3 bacterium]|uniref:NUDIX hydrolase n=1 Tax=candidate division WWE3 bacterium TaxID=2053526 RepID=A0A955LKS4_UNCKA|nr:NUDIX hydrolase [candidate division WWE3 bacterium]